MAKMRESTGGAYESRGKFYARVTVAPQEREGVLLPWCTSLDAAKARGEALQAMVNLLREADQESWIANVIKVGGPASPEDLAELEGQVADIVRGKIVAKEPAKNLEAGTTETVLASYRAARVRNGRADATLEYIDKKIIMLLRHLPARASDIDYACLTEYIDKRIGAGVRRTSVRKELKVLKPALQLARKMGHFARDPDDVVPSIDDDYEPGTRWLEPLEIVGLASLLGPGKMARVAFAIAVGSDPGAVDRVRHEDVRKDFMGARVRGTKNENRDRFAAAPLPEQQTLLRWAVAHADGKDGLLFSEWKNVGRDLPAACEVLSIPKCCPTDLRRTYATWLRDAGVTTDLIGVAMGHAGRTMVERVYGRIKSDDDLLRLMRNQVLAAAFAAANAAAESEDEEAGPRNLSIPPWFRRKDSNLDKRLQRPLSCR